MTGLASGTERGSPASPLLALPPKPSDAARRADLIRMKRIATGLLGVALLVYLVARSLEPAHPWIGFLRAMAEASLVGGVADWFAVTALFRKPLGLPIPHTAIIQTQKDRIGQLLGGFVENHFLARDVLAAKLQSMKLAERAARWTSDGENSRRLARHVAVGVAQAVQSLPEAEARELIRENAVARLKTVRLAPVVGNLLSAVTTDDRHQVLLEEALRLVRDAIEANRDMLRQKIREESPWWVPGAVDDAFHKRIVAAAETLIGEVNADRQHPLRIQFDAAFRDFIDRLKHSPEVIARTESIKQDLLEHPGVQEFAAALWDRARQGAVRLSSGEDSKAIEPLARGIVSIGESLLANEARMAELDEFLTQFIASIIAQHQHEVGDLITRTVRRWDPEVAAERFELAVGRDLQFIRLNGTLVGGLAGLVIYALSRLLH